ncbi:MAG TPA: hypothetical protein VKU00_34335 [Chthonomonadaceae bacterium]|nr:hypothetical protein [Chthonomonadaceae bacterium]
MENRLWTHRQIAARVPPGVASCLLVSRQDVTSIVAQQNRSGVSQEAYVQPS